MKDKLTLQELELLNTASAYNGEQHKAICGKAALELIEYKKIEEELGIDLITLSKALKNGIYLKIDISEEPLFVYQFSITRLHSGKILLTFSDKQLKPRYFKDYGKTWALTKEELE